MSNSVKSEHLLSSERIELVGNPTEVQKKLLARMEELRTRNAELRKYEEISWEKDVEILRLKSTEEDLKRRLDGLREAQELSHERRDLYLKEIATLKIEIEKNDAYLSQVNDDYNRKLARISDRTWEKEIEIKSLKASQAAMESEIAVLQQLKAENGKRITESTAQVEELKQELKAAIAEIRSLEDRARNDARSASDQVLHVSKDREEYVRQLERAVSDLQGQVKILAIERDNVDDRIRNRTDSMSEMKSQIEKLQSALRNIETNHSAELQAVFDENRVFVARLKEKHTDALSRMKVEFDSQHQSVRAENLMAAKEMALRFEEQINEIKANHGIELDALEQIERDLMAEISRLRVESAGQTKHIESLSQSIRELKSSLQEERQKTARNEESITKANSQIQKMESDAQALVEKSARLQESADREQEQRSKIEFRLDDAISKNTELVGQLASLHEQLSMKESDLRDLKESLSSAVAQYDSLKRTFSEFERAQKEKTRETHLVHQNAMKEEKLKRQAEAIEWSQRLNEFQNASAKDLATLKSEKNDFALQLTAVKAESESIIENLRATIGEFKREREDVAREFEKFARDNDTVARERDAFKLEVQRQVALVTDRDQQLVAIKAEHEDRLAKVDSWMARKDQELRAARDQFDGRMEAERTEHAARLQTERTALNFEISELETKIEALMAENANLRIAMATRNSNVEAESREFEIRSQHREKQIAAREKQASVREMQLRQYASTVTDQKTELIRQTKVLAEEIQMAAKMHPLKDYLQLTDFELSRAEVQLKLTPTISSDRAKLESHVKQMVEQRDFLRRVVQESEHKFADQANTILELIRSPKLAATPPPPPRFAPKVESGPVGYSANSAHADLGPVDSPVLDN